MEGLKINCLYAYDCNTAKILNLNNLFKRFISGEMRNFEKVKLAVKKLDYFPRLILIAEEKKKDVFDKEVACEYWFKNHTNETIKKIVLLKDRVDLQEIAINILLDSTISWARVIDNGKIEIKRVLFDNNQFCFSKDEIVASSIVPMDLKKGDLVSVHLGSIREKISKEQVKIISESTQEFLKQIV